MPHLLDYKMLDFTGRKIGANALALDTAQHITASVIAVLPVLFGSIGWYHRYIASLAVNNAFE